VARASGRHLTDVLAGTPGVDVAALLAGGPDVGEAGAQVDAALLDHTRLTEGTP
jgi:3-carboxy-cis,cis-muconate cycloisomerase